MSIGVIAAWVGVGHSGPMVTRKNRASSNLQEGLSGTLIRNNGSGRTGQ